MSSTKSGLDMAPLLREMDHIKRQLKDGDVEFFSPVLSKISATEMAIRSHMVDELRKISFARAKEMAPEEIISRLQSKEPKAAEDASDSVRHQFRTIIHSGRRSVHGHRVHDIPAFFKAMDRNHDGLISESELTQGIRRLDPGLTEAQVENLLD